MRVLPAVLAFFPSFVLAEEIALTSDVAAVTLYPQGATVVREIPFEIPAGQHELILADLPRDTPLDSVRVSVEGAAMGSLAVRDDFVPPRTDDADAAIEAAEARVERLEQELREALAEVESIRLEREAAEARVAFLEKLGEGEGVAQMDVAALRELVEMIGEETLAAKRIALEAKLRAETAERDLKDLREELKKARQALAALVPEEEERAMLAVSVSAEAETRGKLTVTYNIWQAGWRPVYDLRLDRDSGRFDVERGALVSQHTGENWRDVDLTLSTVRPSEQTAPGEVWPWKRWIEDPAEMLMKQRERVETQSGAGAVADMAMEEAPVADEEARAVFDGLAVTYDYPGDVSIATGADNVRVSLGDLTTKARIVAKAVPLSDPNAFLMAEITNDMDELILPGTAMYYLDGRFIGQRHLDLIAAGDEAELAFGPIDGLRLERIVRDRSEGDRGLISKSNELDETVEIEIENLTGEAWPLRVIDRVPYSEQDALEVTWQADPAPTEQDVDGRRGVLAWEFELGAGETRMITLDHALEWPEGKVLR